MVNVVVNSILICVILIKSAFPGDSSSVFAILAFSLRILSAMTQRDTIMTRAPPAPFDPVLGALCDFLVWGKPPPNPPTIPLAFYAEKNTTGIVQRMTVLCHCSLCQKSLCRTTNRCSIACEGQCQIHELQHPMIPLNLIGRMSKKIKINK